MKNKELIADILAEIGETQYYTTISKGFSFANLAEQIALMHSELSEALEAGRKPKYEQDEKCPDFLNIEIEFADAILRILQYCRHEKFRIGEAILAKLEYNQTRPYKHGGKKF